MKLMNGRSIGYTGGGILKATSNGLRQQYIARRAEIKMSCIYLKYIKHLMTGPKGNSEFCFPETLNVPRGEAEGNIEVEGKQNSLFPEGPGIKCFVIPPNSK